MENQSLQGIANQINQQSQAETLKRGRGRPKKETNQSQTSQQTSQTNQQTNSFNQHYQQPYNESLIPVFKATFEFIDDLLADQYKDDSLKNKPSENDFIAKQSSEAIQDFVPSINSKYLKLFLLVMTMIVLYGKKFIIIKNKEEKKKQEEKLKKDSAIDIPVKPQHNTGPFSVNPAF